MKYKLMAVHQHFKNKEGKEVDYTQLVLVVVNENGVKLLECPIKAFFREDYGRLLMLAKIMEDSSNG